MTVLCTARIDDSVTARLHHCTLPAHHDDDWHRGPETDGRVVRWKDGAPGAVEHSAAAPACPTDCDDDCDAPCHEGHYRPRRRHHQLHECPSVAETAP
ncbi:MULTISPECIES: hypothetical protein [Streptomyces]|uniref:Uncharacterized protein n=2 Tax=Luedemannella helvata TaxID=349315 RepID=A0ABP4XHL9_9ACTN|nr:hypothetical protein [Streptomyces virginiae]